LESQIGDEKGRLICLPLYTVGIFNGNGLPISFFTASTFAISIASGITIFAWLGTMWYGKNLLRTPMMLAH
jgi:heme/copper-type cytochrome/quinol oxidase subunit 1